MSEEKLSKLLEDIDSALHDLKICRCNVDVTTKGHKWETYYGLDDDLIKYIRKIENSNKNLQSKIDKTIEYLTSYDAISTIQGLNNIKKNKELDENTINIMTNRYLEVHHKLLDILKENK